MCKTVYAVKFTKTAAKDYDLLQSAGLNKKRDELITIVQNNPLQYPPEYELMKGDKKGLISRRINKKHRFVYEILLNNENEADAFGNLYMGIVKIVSMWTHYDNI